MLSTSIDLTTLPDDLVSKLVSTIKNYEHRESTRCSWAEVLDHGTDEEILAMAAAECREDTPISFARNYESNWKREIVPYSFQTHPRRPVIMRGARYICYMSHSFSPNSISPNGWLFEVYKRALRMSKKTLIDWEEILDFTEELARRVAERHPHTSYHFWQYTKVPDNNGFVTVLMKGRWVFLDAEQYRNVAMMHKVIRKAEKLADRLTMLKQEKKDRANGSHTRKES